MFFKDFVSVKRKKIKKGASQTYDTPSDFLCLITENIIAIPVIDANIPQKQI